MFERPSRSLCVRHGNNILLYVSPVVINIFSSLKLYVGWTAVTRSVDISSKKERKKPRRYNTQYSSDVAAAASSGRAERLENATKLIRKIPVRARTGGKQYFNIVIIIILRV